MKVIIKYKNTEIEVSDEFASQEDRGLIYYNQEYLLKLLEKIASEIVKINNDIND